MSERHESKPSLSVCVCNDLVEACAKTCHEANRAYCLALGDSSQPSWDDAPEWQKESAIKGVRFHVKNPEADASASHNSWMEQKIADGWKFGEVKDAEAKTHPCLVPFDRLPKEQQAKDYIFRGIVHGFTFDCPNWWTPQKQAEEGAKLLLAASSQLDSPDATGSIGKVRIRHGAIVVVAKGSDEAGALDSLADIISSSFSEDEGAAVVAALSASTVPGLTVGKSASGKGWDLNDALAEVHETELSDVDFMKASENALDFRIKQREEAAQAASAN